MVITLLKKTQLFILEPSKYFAKSFSVVPRTSQLAYYVDIERSCDLQGDLK